MVATPSDLNKFFAELIGGKLLPAAQLAEMRTTVPAGLFPDGRAATVAVASLPDSEQEAMDVLHVVDIALCTDK